MDVLVLRLEGSMSRMIALATGNRPIIQPLVRLDAFFADDFTLFSPTRNTRLVSY